jgi:hypothetical protein
MISGEMRHVFAARCPDGHRPPQAQTLRELRSPAVRFQCDVCGKSWSPDTVERMRALEFAEASEWKTAEAPPSAA